MTRLTVNTWSGKFLTFDPAYDSALREGHFCPLRSLLTSRADIFSFEISAFLSVCQFVHESVPLSTYSHAGKKACTELSSLGKKATYGALKTAKVFHVFLSLGSCACACARACVWGAAFEWSHHCSLSLSLSEDTRDENAKMGPYLERIHTSILGLEVFSRGTLSTADVHYIGTVVACGLGQRTRRGQEKGTFVQRRVLTFHLMRPQL